MDSHHAVYDAATAALHNACYENWKMIAKPIIAAPSIDLLTLPRNTSQTGVKIQYDPAGTASANDEFPGVAHSGADQDDVPNPTQLWPVVTTSVTFQPGIYTTDMTPATTVDYQQLGIGSVPAAGIPTSGIPYIPSVYNSTGTAWTRPYTVTLTSSTNTYIIAPATYGITVPGGGGGTITYMQPGDIVEFLNNVPIYNLTQRAGVSPFIPAAGATNPSAIPCVVNEDTGQLNFSIPAVLMTEPGNIPQPYNRRWNYTYPTVASINANTPGPWNENGTLTQDSNILDLTQPDDNGDVSLLDNYSGTLGVLLNYAFLVPGTVQVYGPDMSSGPNNYQNANSKPVLYTPVGNGLPGDNQYSVDYLDGRLMFGFAAPPTGTGTTAPPPLPSGQTFTVTYNYQSNLYSPTVATPVSAANAAQPLAIQVSYRARDVIALHVGVRYLDAIGVPQNSVLTSSVKVGNMNH